MTPRDVPAVAALMNAAFRAGGPGDMLEEYAYVYAASNLRHCFAAFAGSHAIAHVAARAGRVRSGASRVGWASYGNVCTRSEWRGRGIAGRLQSALWRRLRADGVDGLYISGGRSLYTRAGAVECGDYRTLIVPRGPGAGFPAGLAVRVGGAEDAPALARLQDREPSAWVRSAGEIAAVLATGRTHDVPATVWLVTERGVPVAYAVVGPPWRGRIAPGERGVVLDYAGARSALIPGLREIVLRLELSELRLSVPAWDQDLCASLGPRTDEGEWEGVPGTMVLLDPLRFWRRLAPDRRVRLGRSRAGVPGLRPAGRGFEFRLGRTRHRVQDVPALTRLLLGDAPEQWRALLPAPGPLHDALAAVLPVRFPLIGLNYM